MKRLHVLIVFLCIAVIVVTACTKPALIPAPTPTNLPPTPSPTLTSQQAPASASEFNFDSLARILEAYADNSLDTSLTSFELNKKISGKVPLESPYPVVVPALFDEENKNFITFGDGASALLLDRYVLFNPITVTATKPPDISNDPRFKDKKMQRGVILQFGLRPDGNPDYEVLKRSTATHETGFLEIFERNPNPDHPFPPPTIPFPIQDLQELANANETNAPSPLMFYGSKLMQNNEYKLTEKKASVAAVYKDSSLIAINGTVTDSDFGARIFTFQNGIPKLAGIIVGSYQSLGQETEAFAIGIQEAIAFFEKETSIKVKIPQDNPSSRQQRKEKERLIAAVSDGLYDFSYDLCDLKNCALEKVARWTRPFEVVSVSKSEPQTETLFSRGHALLIHEYVAVLTHVAYQPSLQEPRGDYEYKHRILWGGTTDGKEGEEIQYEYLKFIAMDHTGKIALFERPKETTFPFPPDQFLPIGNTGELTPGNALYAFGTIDLTLFANDKASPLLFQAINPATVIGFSQASTDLFQFHIHSTMRKEDNGALICALRDGECELAGLIYTPLDNPQDETLGTALTIEFMMNAVREIVCSKELPSCIAPILAPKGKPVRLLDPQTVKDRERIILSLKNGRPDSSSLLLDILHPDLQKIARQKDELQLIFLDETGRKIEDQKTIHANATILSHTYVITSASLFPQTLAASKQGIAIDTSDITSNVIASDGNKRLEARILLLHKPLPDYEVELLPRNTEELEILDVVLIDRENGYALLKRVTPNVRTSPPIDPAISIVHNSDIHSGEQIFIGYSKQVLGETLSRVPLLFPGTISYGFPDSPTFTVNGFVSKTNLGSPIYCVRDGEPTLCGIVIATYPEYADKVQTEGIGLSIDFIFQKIKQKTGIDLTKEFKE